MFSNHLTLTVTAWLFLTRANQARGTRLVWLHTWHRCCLSICFVRFKYSFHQLAHNTLSLAKGMSSQPNEGKGELAANGSIWHWEGLVVLKRLWNFPKKNKVTFSSLFYHSWATSSPQSSMCCCANILCLKKIFS